jgi:hypothetical protein
MRVCVCVRVCVRVCVCVFMCVYARACVCVFAAAFAHTWLGNGGHTLVVVDGQCARWEAEVWRVSLPSVGGFVGSWRWSGDGVCGLAVWWCGALVVRCCGVVVVSLAV